jgi:hypothetical protein
VQNLAKQGNFYLNRPKFEIRSNISKEKLVPETKPHLIFFKSCSNYGTPVPDSRRFAVHISPRGGDKRAGAASSKRSITLRIAKGGTNEIPAALCQLLYVVLEGVDGLDLHLSRHLGEGVREAPLDFELGVQAVAELFRLLHLKRKYYPQCSAF